MLSGEMKNSRPKVVGSGRARVRPEKRNEFGLAMNSLIATPKVRYRDQLPTIRELSFVEFIKRTSPYVATPPKATP